MAKAKERDRDFLMSCVDSRAIPWEFQFQNVRYTMICAMDTVLMSVFILRHKNFITQNALKRDTSPMAEIVKLIDSGDHVKGRYTFVDFNLKCKSKRFSKAKEGDNSFDCTGSIHDVTCNCTLFQSAEKFVKEECS